MRKKINVLLPVSGAVGIGLLCSLYAWSRATHRKAPRNPAGWALIETEMFQNLQFLPH